MPVSLSGLAAPARELAAKLPTAVAAAAVLAFFAAACGAYRWLVTSPRFSVRRLEVRDADRVTPQALRVWLRLTGSENIFRLDLPALEKRLRQHPDVASARLRRQLPDCLVASIREHRPEAVVELGALYLVDEHGVPFRRAGGAARRLLVVTGIGRADYLTNPAGSRWILRRALAVARSWNDGAGRPALVRIHVDHRHGFTLFVRDRDTAIHLGHGNPARMSRRLHAFDAGWKALLPDERHRVAAVHADSRSRHDRIIVGFTTRSRSPSAREH